MNINKHNEVFKFAPTNSTGFSDYLGNLLNTNLSQRPTTPQNNYKYGSWAGDVANMAVDALNIDNVNTNALGEYLTSLSGGLLTEQALRYMKISPQAWFLTTVLGSIS